MEEEKKRIDEEFGDGESRSSEEEEDSTQTSS
jgi:hypothetical protein